MKLTRRISKSKRPSEKNKRQRRQFKAISEVCEIQQFQQTQDILYQTKLFQTHSNSEIVSSKYRAEDSYASEITAFLLNKSSLICLNIFEAFQWQDDITPRMREMLINWLVEVHMKYRLSSETMFITVHIIDRFLSLERVSRNQLQLVGISAIWIASKFQETYQVPKLQNLVFMCDSTYSKQQILTMQSKILLACQFNFCEPNSLDIYKILIRKLQLTPNYFYFGSYILEAAFFQISLSKFSFAIQAASILFLLVRISKVGGIAHPDQKQNASDRNISEIGDIDWNNYINQKLQLKLNMNEVKQCASKMLLVWQKHFEEKTQIGSLKRKYQQQQFYEVGNKTLCISSSYQKKQ